MATLPGRERELDLLCDHLTAAGHGSGGIVLLTGPAGIGKSAVARTVAAEARERGGSAYTVAATLPSTEPSLGLWTRLAAAAASNGSRVPPVLVQGAVEKVDPHQRYAAVHGLVSQLAPAPAVVVLDDLHSADESSLSVLVQLLPALPAVGTAIIATLRGATAHPEPTCRDLLRLLEASATELGLAPLTSGDVKAWLVTVAADAPATWRTEVAPVLARHSRGNAGVLGALAAELGISRGTLPSAVDIEEHAAVMSGDRLGAVLARHTASLPPSARRLVTAAAVLGGRAEASLVTEVAGSAVPADLEAAIVAGSLERRGNEVALVHPVLLDVLVPQGRSDDVALHRRAADALQRRGRPAESGAVLSHLLAAGPLATPDEVADAAANAGSHALRRGDPARAAWAYQAAADSGGVVDRVAMLLQAAAAGHLAGHRRRAWACARAAADLAGQGRPDALSRAALAFATGREYALDAPQAVTLLREAICAGPADPRLRAQLLALLAVLDLSLPVPVPQPDLRRILPETATDRPPEETAWHWVTRPGLARPPADEAVALARMSSDPSVGASVDLAWRYVHSAPAHLEARLQHTRRALELAGDPSVRADAAAAAVIDHLEAGERGLVGRALTELRGIAAATGDPALAWRAAQLDAMLELASGRPGQADTRSAEAFALGQRAQARGRWVVRLVQRGMIACEAAADPARLLDATVANQASFPYPPIRAGLAYMLASCGRHSAVVPHLEALAPGIVDDPDQESSWLLAAAMTADAVVATGQLRFAAPLADALQPYAEHIAVDDLGNYCHGSVARPLAGLFALLGRRDEAEVWFTRAAELDGVAGLHRFVLAGAVDRLGWEQAQQRTPAHGVRSRAVELAKEAEAAGLRRTAERARSLLQGSRASALTVRQRAVLALLAEQLTYQQIGDRLGYSHSTVRHEAMRLYDALGAGGRDEAVALAAQLGLVDAP